MNIKKIKVGSLKTNCYVLIQNNNCLIIDPGADYENIVKEIKDYNLVGILITHHHFDHVGSLDELINNYRVSIYDKTSLEEKNYQIENFNLDVIFTPGHTNDSITFYFKEQQVMFTGDFLFNGSIGRTDLPTGNHQEMLKSINKIKQYDPGIKIYPGHGKESSLDIEFIHNPYL